MAVTDAIRRAEQLLPGTAAPDGQEDPRWQAVIEVADHISEEPEAVWEFIVRWGEHPDEDLRAAIATCALEHLLEEHFEAFFPRVEAAARSNPAFADTVRRCWKLGQADLPANAARFDSLKEQCRERLDNKQMQRTKRG
jgi:hypothetical protein